MRELLRHSSLRSTLDVYSQAITPAKHADMPQLKEDSASTLMNGFDDSTPRSHLFGGINPWGIDRMRLSNALYSFAAFSVALEQ